MAWSFTFLIIIITSRGEIFAWSSRSRVTGSHFICLPFLKNNHSNSSPLVTKLLADGPNSSHLQVCNLVPVFWSYPWWWSSWNGRNWFCGTVSWDQEYLRLVNWDIGCGTQIANCKSQNSSGHTNSDCSFQTYTFSRDQKNVFLPLKMILYSYYCYNQNKTNISAWKPRLTQVFHITRTTSYVFIFTSMKV